MILMAGFSIACLFSGLAQNNLNIGAIFDEYGKSSGSILIELGKYVLGNHTRIRRYKSLVVPADSILLQRTHTAIADDSSDGQILFESRKNGEVEAAAYCLKKSEKETEYEYVLFALKSKKMTLIYVRGPFLAEQLDGELSKLKRLFIQVNNHLKV
jgi:hypothetical protein